MPYGTPADMKKHGQGPHMESVKQERKNLMKDNPVAKTAAGDRPWISKHFRSMGGSPVKHYDTSRGSHSHPHGDDMKPKMDHK